jgi:hypothetical protein
MKISYLKAISLTVIIVVVFSLVPIGRAQGERQDYAVSFLVQNRPDGDMTYELNVTIPYELYQYYRMQNHFLFSPADLSMFITPYTLKPIADRLWQIYNNTEDFTNGILMLVHQITYEESAPCRYPVETLVAGEGDCDLFAFIAASILSAGEIPVVLLYFKEQSHMEIGVDIGSTPKNVRTQAYSVNYQNVSYYIGECTGSNWRQGWRVGECPTNYQNVSSQVISLKNVEQTSIGQVSASLRELDPSTLTLRVSSSLILESSELVISGQILPQSANENVTMKAKSNGGNWSTIATVETQSDGQFTYTWTPPTGSVDIQASWLGNRQLNGAKSTQNSITILPYFFVLLILTVVLGVVIVLLIFMIVRHRKTQNPRYGSRILDTLISEQQVLVKKV